MTPAPIPGSSPASSSPASSNPVDVTTTGSGALECDIQGVGWRTLSGRAVADVTVEAMRTGEIGAADLRIHPETLERQAEVAERHANPQLAGNLRRAAELTRLPDDEVLAVYEALRPGRSTAAQLTALAGSLADRGLPRCAALIAEAAEVYARRGLSA
ncbi:MAG TPA: diol dehydratase small subunit [Streptosporangiaceae bacterium]